MRNLSQDPTPAFQEFKNAVSRKAYGADKEELEAIENEIGKCYDTYDQSFKRNIIETITPEEVGLQHKDVLLGLYSSNAAIIKNFRKRFFLRNPQTYNNLCPYCTISEANTTEHILPKENYPEFAVNLLNIITACSLCNSKKGEDIVNKNGDRFTLNFYLDHLPDVQYLFVKIENNHGVLQPRYFINDPGNKIDKSLFNLIVRHYERYGLVGKDSRFDIKAIQELSEIINTYLAEGFDDESEYGKFTQKQLRKCDLDVHSLGLNHWKVVLNRSVAQSDVFKQYILSH